MQTIVYAHTSSAACNGLVASSNLATIPLGGATGANGWHALLRFATGDSIASNDKILPEVTLEVTTATSITPTDGFLGYGSDFGAGITIGDYNRAESNTSALQINKIGSLIAADLAVADGDHKTMRIPSVYVGMDTGEYTDIEIRPDATGTPLSGHSAVIYGPAAATNKPKLTIEVLTAEEYATDETFNYAGTNDETYLAIAQEPIGERGVAYKGVFMLPMSSSDLDIAASNLVSNQRGRDRFGPHTAAPGPVGAAGTAELELTPESIEYLLPGMFKIHSTTDLGVIDGVQVYEREWRCAKSQEVPTFTFIQRLAGLVTVHPGSRIQGFAFRAPMGQNVGLTVPILTQEPTIYDDNAVDYDNGDLNVLVDGIDRDMSPQITQINLLASHGIHDGVSFQDLSFSIMQNVTMEGGYTRSRGPVDSTVGRAGGILNATATFKNKDLFLEHLGISKKVFPVKPGKLITFRDFVIDFEGYLGVDYQQFKIIFPKSSSITFDKAIGSNDGPVTASFSISSFFDATYGGVRIITRSSIPTSALGAATEKITVLAAA